MLNSLRRGAKSIFAKLLIALLVFAFAIWGVADFVNQVDPTEVARVGDTPVPANEFARIYDRFVGQMSQQIGQGLSPEEAVGLGLHDQVLNSLLVDALQVDAAHRLGLDLGDEALAERIRNDPTFAGPNGAFSRQRFDLILAENRYEESEFVELQRDAAAREMLINAMIGGMSVPEPYLKAFNRYANQTRRVSFFRLTENDLPPLSPPTEGDLRQYYEENVAEFRAPEYRTIALTSLSPDALADPAAVSEAAVREAYERDGAYGAPERRRVQQVVLDDMNLAERAAEALNEDTSFFAILTELDRSFEDTDLGFVARDDLADPAVAEAAFALDPREAAAVEGRFGPVLVRVSEIDEGGKEPFAAVEDAIRADLALREAMREMRDVSDSVIDAFAGGATVSEVAQRFDLPVHVVTVSRSGVTPEGARPDVPNLAAALTTAFDMSVDDEPAPARSAEERTWVEVRSVTPAADRPFADVRQAVADAWVEARQRDRLAEAAAEAAEALRNGTPVETVAGRYNVDATTTNPFSRAEPTDALGDGAVEAAFEGGRGHVADVITDPGEHTILKVVEITEPVFFAGAPDLAGMAATLNDGIAEAIITDFVTAYQADVGATRNETIINRIVGLDEQGRM